jgi:hypothetical protein
MRTLVVAGCLAAVVRADPPPAPPLLTEVPAALGSVAWSASPADMLARPGEERVVVWLGVVAAAKLEAAGAGTRVRLLCRQLPLDDPGPRTLAGHVFVARRTPPGYFVATLDVQQADADARKFVAALLSRRQFALVAGRTAGVERWAGHEAVRLDTARLELDDALRVRLQ